MELYEYVHHDKDEAMGRLHYVQSAAAVPREGHDPIRLRRMCVRGVRACLKFSLAIDLSLFGWGPSIRESRTKRIHPTVVPARCAYRQSRAPPSVDPVYA